MLEDSLVYTFTLNYDPQPVSGAPVVRTSKAAVIVECHYPRYVDQYKGLKTNKQIKKQTQYHTKILN